MSSNDEKAQQIIEGKDSTESVEINNQLGLPGIFDEMTPIDIDAERQRERQDSEVRGEVQRRSLEVSETGAGGHVHSTQESGLERIFLMPQHMQQDTEALKEDTKVQDEALKEDIKEQNQTLREELWEFLEENLRMQQETGGELRKPEKDLRAEMQQIRERYKAETNLVKDDGEKTRLKLKENKEAIKSLKSEVNENRQQITINNNNLNDNLSRINNVLRREIKLNKERLQK